MIAWVEVLGSILNTNNNWINLYRKGKRHGKREKRKNYEIEIEEVNVYTDDCGTTRKDCVTDCIGGGALITPME